MTEYEQPQKNNNRFHRDPRIISGRKQYKADCKVMPEREAWDKFQVVMTDVKTEITGLI